MEGGCGWTHRVTPFSTCDCGPRSRRETSTRDITPSLVAETGVFAICSMVVRREESVGEMMESSLGGGSCVEEVCRWWLVGWCGCMEARLLVGGEEVELGMSMPLSIAWCGSASPWPSNCSGNDASSSPPSAVSASSPSSHASASSSARLPRPLPMPLASSSVRPLSPSTSPALENRRDRPGVRGVVGE